MRKWDFLVKTIAVYPQFDNQHGIRLMQDGQQEERDDNVGLEINAAGQHFKADKDVAKTFMDHTGNTWNLVVKAIAWAIFFGGTCWGLSLLWT